ncbi:MAG: hypothetical protein K5673_03290 [Lachnospiraceae bacterium]|nr:hypothetical protein [Lachnospiraceae bacterium]
MGNVSVDPDGYSPSDTILRLHRCIDSGINGIDFIILPREENESLLEEFILTEDGRLDILKKLELDNYDGWEYSNNTGHKKDIVHLFHYKTSLIPRGVEDAKSQSVKLYIKITWAKPTGVLIVISFHN